MEFDCSYGNVQNDGLAIDMKKKKNSAENKATATETFVPSEEIVRLFKTLKELYGGGGGYPPQPTLYVRGQKKKQPVDTR